ncbi:Dabb family protein [Flavobacterium restrictum]|uniref:Dabb family protein n=2 Tax=Flavobacterium restrictum TaxID=2594428 RepID=A0A553EBS4_9FLAO|nr:Dabb family protein [Flavobacterium restrictum]
MNNNSNSQKVPLNKTIRHSVIFSFKAGMSDQDKRHFFDAVSKLTAIEGVRTFEILKQTSVKNKYEFGISMEFQNNEAYQYYNNHPDHVAFVQNIWLKQVEDFLEIDYESL